MPKEQKNIAARVRSAVEDRITEAGYRLWDLEYVKEGGQWYLRITIDRDEGVDIDDCEKVFRIVDPIVTELDPVEGAYHLEVSSPGLERELRTDGHFRAMIGNRIRLKLYTPENGQRELVGVLKDFDGERLTLDDGREERQIERKRVSKANLYFDFDAVDYGTDEEEPAGNGE